MYRKFFELEEKPFNVNPDPRYLFMTQNTLEALACLTHGIESRKGFVLLTGEVGTGKTTLLNKLLEWLGQSGAATAFVFNPRLTVTQFFHFMMTDFGIPCDPSMKSDVLIKLNNWLIERYRTGQPTVLIVDEAQNLSSQMLEEVRLLTNLETSTDKLLQIVLSGQPELETKMNLPELRQLRQRITLRAKTRPLTLNETHGYIMERLRVAGGVGDEIFAPDAINAIHQYAQGIPRIVNLICEHAMINAFAEQQKPIPPEIVKDVARDFDLVTNSSSSKQISASFQGSTASNGNGNTNLTQALKTVMERLDRVEAIARAKEESKH
jgi:general secretion pathway protein A